MDDYPGNSRKAAEAAKPEESNKKKIEQVTSTAGVRRKKSLSKRMADIFVGGSFKSALNYVFLDVLIPATKDMIADAGGQALERILFGESRHGNRSRASGHNNGYINYSRYSTGPQRRREDPRDVSRRSRAAHNFDEIVLNSRAEADQVLERMYDLLSRYEAVTVADLYDLAGVTSDYTDGKWGWTSLEGAGVTRARDGYLLDLPKPEPID